MKYTIDARVRYSEIDHRGTLTLPGVINYFQDCSTFQSEDIGYGVLRLKEQKRAWVLSYWQIIVDRYPKMGEKIRVGTFATAFKRIIGERNFFLDDEAGNHLARAASVWVYMDVRRGRPVRPGDDEMQAYGQEDPLDMPYEDRKIALPAECRPCGSFAVKRCHIDTNEHVNNCQYVQMAMEEIPAGRVVRQVRVEYKKSAVLGDVIHPFVAEEDGRTVVELCDGEGTIYAVVEFKFSYRRNGYEI